MCCSVVWCNALLCKAMYTSIYVRASELPVDPIWPLRFRGWIALIVNGRTVHDGKYSQLLREHNIKQHWTC